MVIMVYLFGAKHTWNEWKNQLKPKWLVDILHILNGFDLKKNVCIFVVKLVLLPVSHVALFAKKWGDSDLQKCQGGAVASSWGSRFSPQLPATIAVRWGKDQGNMAAVDVMGEVVPCEPCKHEAR